MDLIERLRLETPRPHTPQFRVERSGIYYTVYDADAPIAVVVRDVGVGGAMLDVLKFSPTAAGRPATLPPYNYHYPTRLGYGASFNWSVDVMFQSPDHDKLELCTETARQVVFIHSGTFYEATEIACALAIGYDATIGQYSYDFTWDIDSTRDVTGEFCNVFHRNLMHTDMERREYDYGCYVRQGGSWEKYPITVLVTGLQQKLLIGIPLEIGGGSGHLNRNGVAPMIIHRQANVPIIMGSCNTCFDLHQSAKVTADVHTHLESRFADLGRVVAADPDALQMIHFDELEAYPLHMGSVSDFSETITASQPWSGDIWHITPGVKARISDDCAHSGTRSLMLEAGEGTTTALTPYGPALAFENFTDYEVSAWVRTEGDAGVEASLAASAFLFLPTNVIGSAHSALKGPHDWTKLVACVNSGVADNGSLTLKLSGNGRAWFDDILIRKVN